MKLKIKKRLKKIRFSIRYFMQRLFSPHHLSEWDFYNLKYTMAEWIYPRLKKFINMERHGYPGIFSEYDENEWDSWETFDIIAGGANHIGGGGEEWERRLQEMLFAFEWLLYFDDYKSDTHRSNFCKRWNIKNPYEKNLENKTIQSNNLDDEMHERAQKGFELFGKHFLNLWN